MDFKIFKTAVAAQFERMAKQQLFRTSVSKDAMWETYLGAFPPGTNEIYKERREYDCNCCKGFIRAVGDVVALFDGRLVSVWDLEMSEPAYQQVADKMAKLVKASPLEDLFLHFESKAGTEKSLVETLDGVKTWNHFFVNLPRQYVTDGKDIATKLGDARATHDVLDRGLKTITLDALDTVLDLIKQNTLYRGAESLEPVKAFRKLKAEWQDLSELKQANFSWRKSVETASSIARLRNTAMGTLLVDLSEGKDLEDAVKAFEAMVAPANYKRPTALVTKAMIDKAKATIEELGLTTALERRYATLEDITVNNILYANRDARKGMGDDVFDALVANVVVKPKSLDRVEDVPIEKFLRDILPTATSVEVLVENQHVNNLVSLVAPVDATSRRLFKWDNKFSWSYNGDFADSIKERVKTAGGNVTGEVCCRLAWYNYDDLDLHMVEPSGYEIYFGNRTARSLSGGRLDVDMNAGTGHTREPVENIFYESTRSMQPGTYLLFVHQFNVRELKDVGFEVELEVQGVSYTFAYERAVRNKDMINVAELQVSPDKSIKVKPLLEAKTRSKTVWNISTQTYVPVNVLMLSPNYWDERQVGNKHYFFMLEGCRNDDKARGFYNEFLIEDLSPHRKVIEMVGAKMKTEESERQLSGLGFSSTQRASVTCRVKGSFSRVINLVF